jgi:hypothetical protein
MTVAQTLAIIHGLLDNAKVVMDGERCCPANSNQLIIMHVQIDGEVSTTTRVLATTHMTRTLMREKTSVVLL